MSTSCVSRGDEQVADRLESSDCHEMDWIVVYIVAYVVAFVVASVVSLIQLWLSHGIVSSLHRGFGTTYVTTTSTTSRHFTITSRQILNKLWCCVGRLRDSGSPKASRDSPVI